MVSVLVVEDNDVFREALQLVLGLEPGITVVAARDGASAAVCCAERCPDVAVVDYRLPDVDGVDVTRAIRSSCPGARVIALTAAADEHEEEALYAAGAAVCLRKTQTADEIVAAVLEAAGRGRGD